MKHFRMLIPLILFSLFLLGCTEEKKVDIDAEKEAIEDKFMETVEALNDKDWNKFGELITDNWSMYNQRGMKLDFNGFKGMFQENISDHNSKVNNIKIMVSDDASMAMLNFDEYAVMTFKGKKMEENAIFTAVYVKKNNEWKMRHLHRSTEPQQMKEPEEEM